MKNVIHCEDCRYYRDILTKEGLNITQTYDYDKENKTRHLCVNRNEFKENAVGKCGEYLYPNCLIKNKDYDCSEYSNKKEDIQRQRLENLSKEMNEEWEKYLKVKNETNDRIYDNLFPEKRGFFKTIKWILFCK